MHEPIITETTRTNYGHGWARFEEWCEAEGRDPLSADGPTVAEFLHTMSGRGYAPGTLRLSCASITDYYRYRHPRGPQADPTKTDDVRRALQHIARSAARSGRTVKKATPLTADLLEKVARISALRRSGESVEKAHLRHLEGEATVRLMFDSALRGDELVRAEWRDLAAESNGGGFRTLHIRVSKTDQTGKGRYGNVSPTTWAALQRWRTVCPTPEGRISTAASVGALAARFKRLGKVSGIEGLSAHSPRRGVATELGRRGASEFEISAVGGWKSPNVVRQYVDAPHAASNAVCMLYEGTAPQTADPAVTDSLARIEQVIGDSMAILPYVSGLSMAVGLGASADDPPVAHARAKLLELWPGPVPPADCARPGCCGLVTVANPRPGEVYCSARCRNLESEARRPARNQT